MPKVTIAGFGDVNFPDSMTPEQIQSAIEKDILPKRATAPKADPTADMSFGQKFLAGAGKSFVDIGRGIDTLVTDVAPHAANLGLSTRKDVDESKLRDAPLMKTGAGLGGNITGSLAALAPTALIPGANTITGGAALGGLMGAMQPVGTDDSRMGNIGIGGIAGGALPAIIKALKVGKAALVDPFTKAGQERVVGGTLNRAASDPEQAIQALQAAKGSTPEFAPTAAQASGDAGLSSLERTARAIDPSGFGAVDQSQRAALVNALRSVAKTPEERAAAETAREGATKALYGKATQATVEGDPLLAALMKRPSMQAAAQEAENLAKERGGKFAVAGKPAESVTSTVLDAAGKPIMREVPEVAASYPGQALHDLKMGLDTAISDPARGFQGAKRDAALGTKGEYLDWLEKKIPEYGQARKTYADMSKPINQMDIGKELYNRFVPALADGSAVPFKSRADALAQALRNGDDLAKNVTGMKGATFAKTMEPDQIALLQGVVKDSQMKAAAETAGRGPGSDTVQKMAMSNLIAETGLPSWISSIGRVPGGMLRTAGDILYTKNDETMRHLLADILKNPQSAAAAMEKAGVKPSQLAEYLKLSGQGSALALPAVVNAQKQ